MCSQILPTNNNTANNYIEMLLSGLYDADVALMVHCVLRDIDILDELDCVSRLVGAAIRLKGAGIHRMLKARTTITAITVLESEFGYHGAPLSASKVTSDFLSWLFIEIAMRRNLCAAEWAFHPGKGFYEDKVALFGAELPQLRDAMGLPDDSKRLCDLISLYTLNPKP
jgi:hypothetical protein